MTREIKKLERSLRRRRSKTYRLLLYVTGSTPRSIRAVTNVRKICEEYLRNGYKLKVIDIYQQPRLARQAQIVALPTLIKSSPEPLRRLIGDFTDREHVLAGLGLARN